MSFTDDSHVRFWLRADTDGAALSSFNVAAVTDAGVGSLIVTLASDFGDATWCFGVAVEASTDTIAAAEDGLVAMIAQGAVAAGSVTALCKAEDGVSAADPASWSIFGYGTQ